MPSLAFVAGNNISPCRFVVSGGASNNVIQASGTSTIITGISGQSPELAPIPLYNTAQYASSSGNPVLVYGLGEECLLEIASGVSITAGTRLTSDSNGCGTGATTGQQYGAYAPRSMQGGGYLMVQVQFGVA